MSKRPGLIKTSLDELTYLVNGLAMEIQSELRPGHREEVYQNALANRLREAGKLAETEKRIEVYINETLVGYMYVDIWVEQQLVVECKAHPHQLTNEEIGQTIAYLAATGSPVGLLYNFGRQKLEFKRILPPKHMQEWQSQLYRCVWTPPAHPLPPLTVETAIRFSVVSSAAHQRDSSVPIRSSVSSSVDDAPSVPIRSSVSSSVDDAPSVPIRSSVSSSVDSCPSTYAASGVSIDAGNRAVELMRAAVQSTCGPEVLAGIGAFGGLFDAGALKAMAAPVLVASTDGVGTKVRLAAQAGRYESLGHDLVNHCVNDILVQGARPLFFLDYVATARLEPERVAAIVKGMAEACRAAGCALLGGETAEMPGVYAPGELDVAGTIVGVAERDRLLPRPDIQAGDVLLGLRSSGPHTNGYSLIRKVFEGVPLDAVLPELGVPLADALLAPHRSYLPALQSQISNPQSKIKALAHITGGGFIENIPRVLPPGTGAVVRCGSWPVPPIFALIQQRGGISSEEMHRVFNMGIGLVVVCDKRDANDVRAEFPEESYMIGEVVSNQNGVILE